MTKKRAATTDAVEILHRRYFAGKPKMLALLGGREWLGNLSGSDR
jgi:hypothetical protein